MPGKTYQFGYTLYDLIKKMIEEAVVGFALGGGLNLGGDEGPDGGTGNFPRPPVGQLRQPLVAYDTTEAATPENYGVTRSGWDNSLLDNLNHIRYWMKPARWFEPVFDGTLNVDILPGVWWLGAANYIDFDGSSVTITSPDTDPRIDVIYLEDDGSLGVKVGTPAASPTPSYPDITHLPICELYIKDSSAGGITVSGIGYFYQSGYAQGYLLEDVRPFFGVNYDADYVGATNLYDLDDVSSTVETPNNLDVLTYDSSDGLWYAIQWVFGGLGGGHPTLQVDGPIVTLDHVGGAYVCTRSGELTSVYIYCKDPGTAGQTTVDINLDGASVFNNPSDRPSLAYNDANKVQRSASLSGVGFQSESVFTADIDEVATNAEGLTIVLGVDIPDTHPYSLGPHTGVLWLTDLQDGIISGYPLISQGNGMAGGPQYEQIATVGIQNDAITYDKLGEGAPKVQYRQGGDSSDWSTGGTTDYDLTATNMKLQAGARDVSVPGSTGSNPWKHKTLYTITFPSSFTQPPLVYLATEVGNLDTVNSINVSAEIKTVTATNFSFYAIVNEDVDRSFVVFWYAIGPE